MQQHQQQEMHQLAAMQNHMMALMEQQRQQAELINGTYQKNNQIYNLLIP